MQPFIFFISLINVTTIKIETNLLKKLKIIRFSAVNLYYFTSLVVQRGIFSPFFY